MVDLLVLRLMASVADNDCRVILGSRLAGNGGRLNRECK